MMSATSSVNPARTKRETAFIYKVDDGTTSASQEFTITVVGDSAPVLGSQSNLVFTASNDAIQPVTLVAATGRERTADVHT